MLGGDHEPPVGAVVSGGGDTGAVQPLRTVTAMKRQAKAAPVYLDNLMEYLQLNFWVI